MSSMGRLATGTRCLYVNRTVSESAVSSSTPTTTTELEILWTKRMGNETGNEEETHAKHYETDNRELTDDHQPLWLVIGIMSPQIGDS